MNDITRESYVPPYHPPIMRTPSLLPFFSSLLILFIFLVFIGAMSEAIWPESGLMTRLFYGNAQANDNVLARSVMGQPEYILKFRVAGRDYLVMAPVNRRYTAEVQRAVRSWAAWKSYPVYAVDGPLAVDP